MKENIKKEEAEVKIFDISFAQLESVWLRVQITPNVYYKVLQKMLCSEYLVEFKAVEQRSIKDDLLSLSMKVVSH